MTAMRRGAARRGLQPKTGLIVAACVLLMHVSTTAAQQQQQQAPRPFMTVVVSSVTPRVETRYTWAVDVSADATSVTVPVNSNTGWPQVRYTVTYTRNREPLTVYVLAGSLLVSSKDRITSAIYLPNVTVTTTAGVQYRMPEEAIQCPSLVVPAGGSLNCTFAAGYAGPAPLPGTIAASVSLAGTLLPMSLEAAPARYDFMAADQVSTGLFATTSNYFELGPGIMQPYGVYGEQPPPGLRLEDGRTFKFIAVFGSLTASNCGRDWKAINTAELTPSSPSDLASMPAPKMKSSQAIVTVLLSGCDGGPAGFSEQVGTPTPAPAPVQTPTPALLPPGQTAVLPPAPPPEVSGVEFAEAGSTLCGRGVCPKGQRCFDGWNCCPVSTPVCGGKCCEAPSTCAQNRCIPPGGTLCGTAICQAGETCTEGVCCAAGAAPCGKVCCSGGQTCLQGVCAAPGSQVCGTTVCAATQTCVTGVCCAPGETACGGRCCGVGNTCLQGQFCAPAGSSVCGNGQICNAPQQCAGGAICCDVGASFCGGGCCPSTNVCQANRCLTPGQSICGAGLICNMGQTCQGGVVCCDQGTTFCNNACCPQGNVCINNQCVVTGSVACGPTVCPPNQICGNTQTGVCCQSLQQFGCGQACCNTLTQVCNQFTQQCTERFNTACGAGQFWCPGANVCCPVGQDCMFNQCVPRNAIGRRLHMALQ